ncbi:MAG: carboxypeptidase regulatory-like domain-containing protein [Acidobacteria bacterium]|nr:carboxypeptidase regulatory-like domain-containing protein [Acidobacteriota bacterium]
MLQGQVVSGNVVGTISDPTGAAIPSARVQLTNVATGVKYTTITDQSGLYHLYNIPVGHYDVAASAPGFTAASLQNLSVELNKNATANLQLQVGTLTTTVDVTEAAAAIDTTTAQVQSNFDSRQIVNLPIIENAQGLFGALNLALLSAGVASNGGVGQGTGPSVGGQRPTNNNFMIEGVDNNNKTVTGPLVYVPTEATSEFTLLENQYGSEFGHSTGGQFNTIVKSGTNQVHGSAYEYFQNRNLNGLDQSFARQGILSNPRFDQNRLGATIGGPIKKDKLFYFGNFEYAPLGQAFTLSSPVLSPTAQGYAMLDSMANLPGFSKTNYDVFKKYVPAAPTASSSTTVNGQEIPTGILPIAGSFFNNYYTAIGSVDYNLSDSDQFRGRIIYNRSDSLDNAANLPSFWTTLPQRYYLASIANYHTFSPNLTNELRLAFNRFSQYYTVGSGLSFPGLDTFPNLQFDNDLGLQLGPDPNAPQYAIQNTYQLAENLSWTKGRHTLKFGFDGRNVISPQHFIQRERGDYDYPVLADYLFDRIPDDLAERNLGDTTYYGNQWATYLYATDVWRVKSNLSLDLGLRWERTTTPLTMQLQSLNAISNVPGLIDFHSPRVSNRNFAPRLGIAYSPGNSGRTSIRAGFGMGYDVIFDNVGSTAYPPQLSSTFDAVNYPNIFQSPFLANGGIRPGSIAAGGDLSQADARAATSSYIYDMQLPYSIQWNVGIQHVFHENYTFEARYMGTRGVHLLVQDRINRTNDIVTPDRNLPTYLQAPSQSTLDALPYTLSGLSAMSSFNPSYLAAGFTSDITAFAPIGNSLYHGLALQLNRRFSHGLQFVGAYTWSHNIDDSTATHFSTLLAPRRPQSFADLRPERANSALDRRQRFTLSWVWEAPWYQHSNGWIQKNVIGNWHFVGTYTAESGEYVTAQSGTDSNLNADSFTDRTELM